MKPIRALKNANRLRQIVSVFARHGFYNIAERINVGQYILERLTSTTSEIEKRSIPERIRMSFEELGPTFVKLGQLLATRPDLIPQEYVDEFAHLHDRVQPLPYSTIEKVLKEEFGENLGQYFLFINQEPIGSASIAQVHRAQLITGEDVVIKVQRPGITQIINEDLNVLYFLAEMIETYIPESHSYNPVAIVDEYFKTLELETNFIVEANNIRRFRKNFEADPDISIPQVYMDLTTERCLTLEAVKGIPLSQENAIEIVGCDRQEIVKKGLRAYLKMVFADGLFHGDLHAGNFFVMANNRIGLIDFGVVGHLNPKTQSSIANMLLALKNEDYERLAYEYVDLAPFTEQINVDLFAKELRQIIAPFYGLSLKNVNLGKLLMNSSAVAATHGLTVPTELMLFFKSIVHIEGVGHKIMKDFDFLSFTMEIAGELVKNQIEPQKVTNELFQMARESRHLINALPRQINYLFRRLNSPNHSIRLQIHEWDEMRKSIQSSFNLLFLGIVIAALIVSASFVSVESQSVQIAGLPTLSFILFLISGVLSFFAFINYFRK